MLKKVKTTEKPKEKEVVGADGVPEVKNPSNLKELIEKNIKWSQVIYEQNKKIKRSLTLMVVGSYLRLALILIPIILAIFYLPSLLKDVFGQYQNVLGGASGSSSQINDLLGQASSGQLEEILKVFSNR